MKILMTTDNAGGVWSFSLDLAAELRARGHDVYLAVVGSRLSHEQAAALDRPGHVWEHREAKLEWMADPWDDVAATGDWLRDLARRYDPDIVHLNDYAHAARSWDRPVLVAAHSCVVTWWRAVHRADPPAGWSRYRAVVEEGLCAASAVVAPTHAMLDTLRDAYSFSTRGYVIHNGIAAAPRIAPKDDLVVAAARVWDRAKNVAAVARAADGLAWPVVIAGAGTAPSGSATSLGHLSRADLARLLDRAAIFAEPAFYEPFGLTALEAGIRACALVLGDIASLREVWGDAAVYVEPGDDASLTSVLASLIADEDRRVEMGRRARERALGYTVAKTADAYLSIYDELLRARASGSAGALT